MLPVALPVRASAWRPRARSPSSTVACSALNHVRVSGAPLRCGCPLPRPITNAGRELRMTDAPPRQPTVLVVDDDPRVRLAIQWALEDAGLRVVTAEDG